MQFMVPTFERKTRPSGVYRINFRDNYFYIGSSFDLRKRFISWKTNLKRGVNKNKKMRAIAAQSGVISFEVIEFIDKHDDVRVRESFHINQHWDNPFLLNYCPTGDSNKGIRWSDEDLKSRVRVKFFAKPIAVFKDGNLVKKFDFIVDAASFLEVSSNDIRDFLKGCRSIIKGHTFKLIDKTGNYIEPIPFVSKKKPKKIKIKKPVTPSKKVAKFDLSGHELEVYDSIFSAAKSVGWDRHNFKKRIKKSQRGYCAGFLWRYV